MKRKLDDSVDEGRVAEPVKRGCYFQCITSVLFRRENRMNAFKKLSRLIEQPAKPAKQAVCVNCQQLVKKENQKISPGVSCHFCEKHVCFACVQRCGTCEFDFCRFCSDQLYDREKDTYKCLSC